MLCNLYYFSQILSVYGRNDMPCIRCNGTIKKINLANELNVKVIDQKEWMKMLNKTS